MPVSIDGLGSGVSFPAASRSNCMNTRFQISTKRSPGSCGNASPRPASGAEVVMNFRARPARPGLAHLPEIIFFVEPENAALRNSSHFLPQLLGIVVLAKDGEIQLVLRQAVLLGDQLPGVRDGFALEIIAEGEIAQHLEKRVMTPRVADVVQIVVLAAGAHAFLRRRRARVVPLLDAQKHVLELVHPRVGEQQRRVVGRHQR